MTIYRRMIHNKVTPKQYLPEQHCIPHIRKDKFGLGLLKEQRTGNSHQLIAHLKEHRAHGFTNELNKLSKPHFNCTHSANRTCSSRIEQYIRINKCVI